MKLQEAFVSEANAIGDWDRIGYKMEDTPNFDYAEVTTMTHDQTTALSALTSAAQYWSAKNKVAMNDCTVSGGVGACEWKISLEAAASGNGIKATATAGDKMLTPSFEMIGK